MVIAPELIELLRDQAGVVSSAQLRGAGIAEATSRGWIARGHWERLLPNVVGPAGVALSWERMAHATLLQLGPTAWLSHRTAAALIGLGRWRRATPIHALVPYGSGTMLARRGGWPIQLCIHRSRTYGGEGAAQTDGLGHTGPARTIIDVVGSHKTSARDLIASAFVHNLTSAGELAEALDRAGRHPGSPVVRAVLASLDTDVSRARSEPEWQVRELLVAAGLPAPVLNYEIVSDTGRVLHEVDLAYPDLRLGYEYESDAFHSSPSELHRDRRRHRRLASIGWDIRYLSSSDLRTPQRLVEEVAADLARAQLRLNQGSRVS